MDRLDRIALLLLIGLAGWAVALVVMQVGTAEGPTPPGRERQVAAVARIDPALDSKIGLAKSLLADNNLEQAEGLIGDLVAAYPYEAMPYFLRGDVFLYRQDPVAAMLAYRKAVDLNPDFLDKKSDLFQGKKIKKTVEEARGALESGLLAKPDDADLREARKVYYYMLRKIAGSCG